jgi:hypothetical protein
VMLHPDDDDPVESSVGLSVSAAVEPVACGHAGGGRDGCHAAQTGERGFGADPVGVVAGDDEDFGCGVGSDSKCGGQVGRCGSGEVGQDPFVGADLGVEVEPAAGDRAGCVWQPR